MHVRHDSISRHVSKVQNSERMGSETRAKLAVCGYYSHSHDCAVALLFRTGQVEQVDWANPIAGCSGYYDRISPA